MRSGWRAITVGAVLAVGTCLAQVLAMTSAQAATPVPDTPGSTAGFNGVVRTVVYGGNGVVYVGGDFTAAVQGGQTIARNHAAAVDESTGRLLPWNPNVSGVVRALTVDGSWVYVGGSFTKIGGHKHARVARVNATSGAVDNSFNPVVNSAVKAVAVGGSTLYVGGKFTVANGQAYSNLAAFDTATGALRAAWHPQASDMVWSLQAANGWVYVGGQFKTMNGSTRGRYIASVDPTTGALQPGYSSPVTYRVLDLTVTSSTIYIAADGAGGHLRALGLNGQSRWTSTADGAFESIAILGDTVYGGGHFGNVCTTARTGSQGVCLDGKTKRGKFAAYDLNGNLLPWSPQANSALGTWALDADPATGKLAAGGEWTTFKSGHVHQAHFAQFG
jgi:hypothetical protein